MYSINPLNGELIALSSLETNEFPYSMVISTVGGINYAYVTNDNSINMYAIASDTGILIALSPSYVSTTGFDLYITTATIGGTCYVYVANTNNNSITQYSVDTNIGTAGQLIFKASIPSIYPNAVTIITIPT
jgi:6-phosphogluconolactonase (cycloisomerase 2 family)